MALLSCQIDGLQASLFDVLNPSSKESQNTFEVINYIKAIDHGFSRLAKRHISNKLLCEVHKELMDSTVYQQIGQFRTIQTFTNSKVRIMGRRHTIHLLLDYMKIDSFRH